MTRLATTRAPTARDDRTAVDKAVSLLLSFGQEAHEGLGVSELARRADLSKSTAFRLLGMLQRNGVVERYGHSYRLGGRLHELGQQVYAPDHEQVRELVTPFLIELYERTHETAHLAVLHGRDVVYINKLYGRNTTPPPSRVGRRAPAHCTAGGKVLLAYDTAPEDIATASLLRRTSRTITDPSMLRRHLADVRERGVALDNEEARPGLRCVAAPIFASPGRVVAALSVTACTARFDVHAHTAAVREVAHKANRALAAHMRDRRPVG